MHARVLLLTGTLALIAGPAVAIELSLDENREKRGSIGYVDMQKVFKSYPETMRAKENFEELMRQTEEQINLRKADVLRLRNELSGLKSERDFMARIPMVINIPGVSTAPVSMAPPGGLAEAPTALAPLSSSSSTLAHLDSRIALSSKELARKEAEFNDFQSTHEKNLLDLESRKTEILLGKIGKAISAVAHKEGISIVVDKSSIVFGHDAVDLTDKVLKNLQGS